jgi:hypothetical protein
MRLLAPSIVASIHLILLAVALYVRNGGTWVLSGYDRERVADERGLAAWCGNGLAAIGMAGLVAAGLLALAPLSASFVIVVYVIGVAGGVLAIGRGARRFLRPF